MNVVLERPSAKRKLLLGVVFILAYALSLLNIIAEPASIPAWGTFLVLSIMAISAWPFVKEFVWPSGLEHIAVTELSLACHGWKNAYIFNVCPEVGCNLDKYKEGDIWDKILAASHHEYSEENWTLFRPLFFEYADQTQRHIDAALLRYSDVLPGDLRVAAHQTKSMLGLVGVSYTWVRQNPSDDAFYM